MELSDLKNLKYGQRLRVTFEAEFVQVTPSYVRLKWADGKAESSYLMALDQGNLTIDVIEPEYVDGAMYQDRNGYPYMFSAPGLTHGPEWYVPGVEIPYDFTTPARPLTRLVPQSDA
jgi:hypothetical protein